MHTVKREADIRIQQQQAAPEGEGGVGKRLPPKSKRTFVTNYYILNAIYSIYISI